MSETSSGHSLPADFDQSKASGLDSHTISALLWSGLYLWEIVRSLPFDCKVVLGKRACRWGAFFFYLPMRGLAAVFFACAIALTFPPPWQPPNASTLRYVTEASFMLSKVFVYHILAIQVATLWRTWKVSYPIMTVTITLWVVTCYGIGRVRTAWYVHVLPKVFSSFCLALACSILVLYIGALLRARSRSREHSDYAQPSLWSLFLQETLQYAFFAWIAQVVDTGFDLSDAGNGVKATVATTTYVIAIVCGSRAYQHMATRSGICPMTSVPCMLTSAVRMSKKWNGTSTRTSSTLTASHPHRIQHSRQHSTRSGTDARGVQHSRRGGSGDIRVATDAIELQDFGSENFSPTDDMLSAKALSMSTTSPSDDHSPLDGKPTFAPIAPG